MWDKSRTNREERPVGWRGGGVMWKTKRVRAEGQTDTGNGERLEARSGGSAAFFLLSLLCGADVETNWSLSFLVSPFNVMRSLL